MTRTCATRIAIAVSTFACATLFSFAWSEEHGVSMSVDSAQARVGRPLTPVSVAGVARRQTRRAVYGAGAYGVGAGVAAVGTAAAIAATSPGRRSLRVLRLLAGGLAQAKRHGLHTRYADQDGGRPHVSLSVMAQSHQREAAFEPPPASCTFARRRTPRNSEQAALQFLCSIDPDQAGSK